MEKTNLLFFSVATLLILGMIHPSWATVDLNGYLPIAGTPITPTFKFSKNVSFDYPNGGKLKDALNGKSLNVTFTDDSDNNPSIKSFMEQINNQMAAQKSPAIISKLVLNYKTAINGDDKQASIDYLISLTPTLTSFVLSKGGTDTPTVLDVAWIGFNVSNPVTINTKQYGNLEINFPLGLIKNQVLDAYNVIKGTKAESDLNQNLVDASTLLLQPFDQWNALSDPSYIVSDSQALGYNGTKVAVTTFASGQSDILAGALKVKNIDEDFTADANYHLKTYEKASSGTITAEGIAKAYLVQGAPAIATTAKAASGSGIQGGMSITTIYAMAGFAAVIAGGIFWWSNKKMKQVITEVNTGPVEYETRRHWADRFDDTSSNIDGQPKSDDTEKKSPI